MNAILSICIPTMNRAALIIQALQSIHQSDFDRSRVQICISNNSSDEDYTKVLTLIKEMRESLRIDYIDQSKRLSADESMLETLRLANGNYVYFLGDDDYFLNGQISNLVALIDDQNPDLAIFNGITVDANNNPLGAHFNLTTKVYKNIKQAFEELRDKGSYGAVLVKKALLNESHFRALFGTSHGYGCYWISILNDLDKPRKIMIPDFPLVALRTGKKSYNHIKVYFSDIPYEINVYKKLLNPGLPQELNNGFEKRYYSKTKSIRFLIYLLDIGMDLDFIESINPTIFKRIKLKIKIAKLLFYSGAYEAMRIAKRRLLTRKQPK